MNGKSDTKRGNMGSKFTAGALLIAMTLTLTLACSGSNSKPEADPTQQEMLDTIDRMEQEIVALREEVEGQGELDLPIYLFQGQKILGGDIVNIESLTGEKPVVVNFWSAESPPSIHNLTEIQDFHEKYGDQVLVLGVDVRQATGQGTHKEGLDLLTELGITFFAGYVKDDRILTEYGIKGLPTTIFINTDGSVNDKWTGTLNQDVLVEKAGGMLLEGSLLAKAQATEPPGPCDQLLRNQMVFQRGASTAGRMQEVIRQIQDQRDECGSETWNPVVDDSNRIGSRGCWASESQTERQNSPKVGNLDVPGGLFEGRDPASRVTALSTRDGDNNIIIYWSSTPGQSPADKASCWMYVSRLNTWGQK